MRAVTTAGIFAHMKTDEESQVLMGPPRIQQLPNATSNPFAWDFAPVAFLFKQLRLALQGVSREACVIDNLASASDLLSSAAEKLRIECYRVGAISRSVEVKMPSSANLSVKFAISQLSLGFQTYANLSLSLRLFVDKYAAEPFDICKFINMNRIAKAERLFLQVQELLQTTLKDTYLLKFHSLGQLFVCAVKMRRLVRGSIFMGKRPVLKPVKVSKVKPTIDVSSPEESFTIPKGMELQPLAWPISPIHSLEMSSEQVTLLSNI